MENYELRKLAGLPTTLTEKKWSGDVVAKTEPAEGTFTKKAGAIVKELMKVHGGDAGKAMKALTFYCNRAGKDCENMAELDKAKEMLHKKVKMESINVTRVMAGLPRLVEDKEDGDGDADDMPMAKDDKAAKEEDKEEEDDMPKIVKKLAKNVAKKFGLDEEKDGEELEALLMQVYEAGLKDGAKEEEQVKEGWEAKEKAMSDKDNKEGDAKAHHKGAKPDVAAVKKHMVSVHDTMSAANAEAKRLNAEATAAGKQDMKYDVTHVVHCCK